MRNANYWMKPFLIRFFTKAGLLMLFFICLEVQAQKDNLFGKEMGIAMEKSILLQEVDSSQEFIYRPGKSALPFPNVNRARRYYNKKKLALIYKLEAEEEWDDLAYELHNYISSFGIENFKEKSGVDLLWKLGRLRQVQGDTGSAVFFYELAIKHTRNWSAPRIAYDSLMAPTVSEWLPIDTYYRLLELRKKIDPLIPPKSVLQNMGYSINSGDPDYAPYMHPSDSVLIFTSRRGNPDLIDPFSLQNEELYYSVKNFISGEWDDAEKFTEEINSKFNEGSACLSPDGKTLYFTRCNSDDGIGDCDLYEATYEVGHWVNIRNLGPQVNTRDWDSQPNISPDGKILFFSSNRRGGFGSIDLYFSIKNEYGYWTKAQNLGPVINTPSDEVSPFFHSINNTLYFGSNGQLKNYGGFDIFKSRRLENQWEEPKNVGPLVNTRVNEYYFSLDSKGDNIFYSSSKRGEMEIESQDFDLYSFPMPMESRPDAITKLTGVLLDSISGYPLVGTVMVVDLDNGVEIAPKRINDRGYFEFDLKNNNRYRIYVLGENFLTIRNDIVLDGDTTFDVITKSIDQDRPLVFESLEFGANSYKLQGNIKPKLDYIVAFLKRYPMYNLIVEGHTDSDGGESFNRDLSLQRARQIQAYIQKEGNFEAHRTDAMGYGETRPLVPNDSDENKRKNRRVEFRLLWDEKFKGDKFLPMEDELMFDDEFLDDEEYDPEEFLEEFDMLYLLDEDEDFGDDFDDDLLDLDAELEDDMKDLLLDDDDSRK